LENNTEVHTDELKERIRLISKSFKGINFDNILEKFVYDPKADDIHGGSSEELTAWHDTLETRIEDLQILAERQIAERKSLILSGYERKSFPGFSGEKLEYYIFKKTWLEQFSPERMYPKKELASLKAALGKPAQHKVVDCDTLERVWEVLDRHYGDLEELRAALKMKIAQIKIKAHTGPGKVEELFNEVQFLTVKVKAHGGENSLKYDKEYIALLLRHLTEDQQMKWVEIQDNAWDSFYTFLEKLAVHARKMASIQDTLKAIGAHGPDSKTSGDKKACNSCGRAHGGVCYNKSKVVAATEINRGSTKPKWNQNAGREQNYASSKKPMECLICKGAQHMRRDHKTGQDKPNRALNACPRWTKANYFLKNRI